MADAINRDQMYGKLQRMMDRSKQRRDGPYKAGYRDACSDAIQKLGECDSLEVTTVTRCWKCQHAIERNTTMPYCILKNRRVLPDEYCNSGEPDENY